MNPRRERKRRRVEATGSALAAPRWWPTWIGLGLLWTTTRLPRGLQRRLGHGLGYLIYAVAASRRRVVRTNLRICFPKLSDRERGRLMRAHFAFMGHSMLELAFGWWGPVHRLRALGRYKGLENLRAAHARGRGVILLQGHFLTTDIAGQILGMDVPFTATYSPPRNPVMRTLTERFRGRFVRRQIHHQEVRAIIRALSDNEIIWHGPDQGAKKGKGIDAKFFGRLAATNTSTAKLARISGAPVVPYHPVQLPDGTYELRFEPALEDFPGPDIAAATQRVNDTIERQIRDAPEQYLWAHKRFRRRDQRGTGSPYKRKKKNR